MALSEKSRAEMYRYFSSTPLGEEVTSEMIASFPDYNLEDLVTKDFLRAELSERFATARGETATLRTDMTEQFGAVRGEIATLRTDMTDQTQKLLLWMVATMVTLFGIMSGLIVTLH